MMASVSAAIPTCPFRVLETFSHDENNFTQGLILDDHVLYESVGGYGSSRLIKYQWPSMRLDRQVSLPKTIFAEGIALLNNQLYQLTWKEGEVIVYDAQDLQVQSIQPLRGQGWGLAAVDDQTLIRSDGTHCLYMHEPKTFRQKKSKCQSNSRFRFNALASQDGVIYANHYPTDDLYRIDQRTGKILDVLNLTSLRSGARAQVTNGVAAAGPGMILVTGKHWNKLYRLDVSACRSVASH